MTLEKLAETTKTSMETILVVEDDRGIATLQQRRLQRAGYKVVCVTNAEDALRRIQEGDIALAVLDQMLSGDTTGLELYKQLKASGCDLPVIMVTGKSDEAVVIEALRLGVRDFITKSPEYLTYLPEAIDATLGQARLEQRLKESEERFRSLVQNASDIVTILEVDGTVRYVSPAVERIMGRQPEDIIGTSVFGSVNPDDRERAASIFASILATPRVQRSVEFQVLHADGSWRYLDSVVSNLVDDPSVRGIVVNSRDITDRKRTEERMSHLAQYDQLTGLANRGLFLDRLEQAIIRAKRSSNLVALMFLDLDHFKDVNDTLGHNAGDELLKEVAARIKGRVRESDTVARLGGDEFAIILEDLPDAHSATLVAQGLLEDVSKPIFLDGSEITMSASIGIATRPPSEIEILPKDADVAMYRAKESGRNTYEFHTREMSAKAAERLALRNQLRRASEDEEFVLYYQPQTDLLTGEIVGVEALLRWQHPDLGIVGPNNFIPMLEETGLIVPVGEWVLKTACRQARAWQDSGFGPLRMAVNLSVRQLMREGFGDALANALEETGCDPHLLDVEITESILMEDPEANSQMLGELKKKVGGIRISVDDFGTGYSSLYYLKSLPIDVLKVGRPFVKGIPIEPDDAAITSGIIKMAHDLRLKVIAEGVETYEQAALLREWGCDLVQGFYFGKPLPPDDLVKLLEEQT